MNFKNSERFVKATFNDLSDEHIKKIKYSLFHFKYYIKGKNRFSLVLHRVSHIFQQVIVTKGNYSLVETIYERKRKNGPENTLIICHKTLCGILIFVLILMR